ncbi:GDP-L-fucose synthase family protein [Maritalea sp.]|uniref:GDP-L-fucose synthase family protein n=1 Tax=Maritalea sp. TaxID=2003361 RepID=UPI003EF268E5
MRFDLAGKKIWVAGHNGMVGKALLRRLENEPCETLGIDREQLDLRDQKAVETYVADIKPDAIILAAATVGGISANDSYPAQFLYDNLMIGTNIVHAAHLADVDRLLFLGSSCIYPKLAAQPIQEDALLTGALEPTNQAYAIAKIAVLKLIDAYHRQYGRAYFTAMPCNLYGPHDNYDLQTAHVLPALIKKAHQAKQNNNSTIEMWGTGKPRREFLHIDDCADALVFLLKNYQRGGHINVGTGQDISIEALAKLVCEIVGFKGEVSNDLSMPDGTFQKCMNTDQLRELGWEAKIQLKDGIAQTYNSFLATDAF